MRYTNDLFFWSECDSASLVWQSTPELDQLSSLSPKFQLRLWLWIELFPLLGRRVRPPLQGRRQGRRAGQVISAGHEAFRPGHVPVTQMMKWQLWRKCYSSLNGVKLSVRRHETELSLRSLTSFGRWRARFSTRRVRRFVPVEIWGKIDSHICFAISETQLFVGWCSSSHSRHSIVYYRTMTRCNDKSRLFLIFSTVVFLFFLKWVERDRNTSDFQRTKAHLIDIRGGEEGGEESGNVVLSKESMIANGKQRLSKTYHRFDKANFDSMCLNTDLLSREEMEMDLTCQFSHECCLKTGLTRVKWHRMRHLHNQIVL